VKHTTLIQNISLKDFLSHIRTKAELKEYLADKVVRHSKSSNNRLKKFMVTSRTHSKGNVDIPDLLLTHSQEEAHVAHTACCKCKYFKAVMSCDDEILDALAVPGNDNDLPSIHVCSWKALFVCCIDQKSTQK